jgi:hypothetical protein
LIQLNFLQIYNDLRNLLYEMADTGKIDGDIIKDLGSALAPYDCKDMPPPCGLSVIDERSEIAAMRTY